MNAKSLAALLLVGLLGAGARAADEDASRQLRNLVYYPHAGQFRATGEFIGSLQDSANDDNSNGIETVYDSESYAKATLALTYGIVDGLRVGVSETDLFNQKVQSTIESGAKTGATAGTNAHGLSDPTVTVAERFYEAPGDGFSADAVGSVTPLLGRAMSQASGGGNDISSGWSATFAVPLYYRLQTDGHANEFEFAPSATRSFGGSQSGADQASSTYTTPYWSGSLVFVNRYHVNDSWYVQPGLTMVLPYTYTSAPQTPGAPGSFKKTSYNALPSLHVGYLPTPRLLIDASVTYSGSRSTTFPPAAAFNDEQDQQTYGEIELQATF